jgi:hypothetical protein
MRARELNLQQRYPRIAAAASEDGFERKGEV